jgi:hypothetical protein
MKKIFSVVILLFSISVLYSQDMKSFKLYKPEENAEQAIADAVKRLRMKANMYLYRSVVTGASGVHGFIIMLVKMRNWIH